MKRCWVIGDACIDLLPEKESGYLKCAGGTGTNIAVCLSKLKVNCKLIAKIGDDPLATFIFKELKKEGVDTEYLSLSKTHKTTLIIVDLDNDGERSFTYMVDTGADTRLTEKDLPEFITGDWICISSVIFSKNPSRETCFKAIERIRKVDGVVCIDANMREKMWDIPELMTTVTLEAFHMADVVKASEMEILKLTGKQSLEDAIDIVREWPCRLVVVTMAGKGSIAIYRKNVISVEAFKVPVVDMTGAGDAFMGAMVAKLMKSDSLNEEKVIEILKYANACGALAVGKKGALSSLPAEEELTDFITGRS
jgi:fructokinase